MKQNIQPSGAERVSFLGAVARAYVARYEEMSDFCFVFPNKRSGSFFLKNLSESLGKRSMLAPEVLDIGSFMGKVSGLETASRIDLLFRLYRVYSSLVGKVSFLKTEEDLLDFDRFAPWGEVIAGDFSEVEQYCVDAAALFANVRDYRSIAANFLSEEQCDIIERYFGYRPSADNVERFWKSVGYEEDLSVVKAKFVELWKLLPQLFEGLLSNLEHDGLALQGTTFKRAMERVENCGREALPWKHVVIVGFNMLSTSEARMFAAMRDMTDEDGEPYADFFWDAVGPVLGENSESKGAATGAMRRNIRNFPMPVWSAQFMAMCDPGMLMPSIAIDAAPSNVAQVKIAGMTVAGWIEKAGAEKIKDARAAIVVPDENLLLPLLHSLPENLDAVNLTMGYSLRYTSVASFVYYLRRLHTRQRKYQGQIGYFYEDVRSFLSHPLVQLLVGTSEANNINGEIARRHLRVVTPEWLGQFSQVLETVLKPISPSETAENTISYLDGVLDEVDKALSRPAEDDSRRLRTFNSKIERSQIAVYRLALNRLLNSMNSHGISMRFLSVFRLIDRLLAAEKITFEGEPLEGLQVMGLLETRALDFDHLIILSMNDKVMPRRSRKRTFIPDSLRRGYGMPSPSQSEELYSYYFYRLLSRASDVTLIYDARAGEGMRSGGKSRYLMQLEMLYAPGKVTKENFTFMLDSTQVSAQSVKKTPQVMEKLKEFTMKKGGRNLSASALMNYCSCQLKFYYKNVVGISDDIEAAEYIDPITQGQIVHRAMLMLYFPEGMRERYLGKDDRIEFGRAELEAIANDTQRIEAAVRQAVNIEHFRLKKEDSDRALSGAVALIAARLARQVRDVVLHDASIAPLQLLGGEVKGTGRFKAGSAPEVNIRYALDRVDIAGGCLRVVDYKTGSSHVNAADFDSIFSGDYKAKYMIQLLLYSHLLGERVKNEEQGRTAPDISAFIYDVNTILEEGEVCPEVGNVRIESYSQVRGQFMEGMEKMIGDIFNPSVDFEPAADPSSCRYCGLRALCGKE